MRLLITVILIGSGCNFVYDFDDLSGVPCRINEGCPTGYSCATSDGVNGECILPRSRNYEESCSRNIQCAEGMICDNAFCTEGQATCERVCRNACEPSNILSCTSPNEWCIPAREASDQGGGFCQRGNCTAAGGCNAREVCVRDPDRAILTGICTQACDMLDSASCGEGRGCNFWFGDTSQAACDVAGTLPIDSECNNGTGSCVPGSICLDQPTESNPNRAVCTQLCDPDQVRGEPCPAPNPSCEPLGLNLNLGVCVASCNPLAETTQCTGDGVSGYSCQPSNPQVWDCGANGMGCTCNTACDPATAEEGVCALDSECTSHRDCPDGTLCSETSNRCKKTCSTRPPTDDCNCVGQGANPTFGVCE